MASAPLLDGDNWGRAFAGQAQSFCGRQAHYRGHQQLAKSFRAARLSRGYSVLSADEFRPVSTSCWIGHAGLMQAAQDRPDRSRGELPRWRYSARNFNFLARPPAGDGPRRWIVAILEPDHSCL